MSAPDRAIKFSEGVTNKPNRTILLAFGPVPARGGHFLLMQLGIKECIKFIEPILCFSGWLTEKLSS